jgi:uncharacterized metal-binding protein YceD (DUF177 family)
MRHWEVSSLQKLDAWQFARLGGCVSACVPISSYERLSSFLLEKSFEKITSESLQSKNIVWQVRGGITDQSRCYIHLQGCFSPELLCIRSGQVFSEEFTFDRKLILCKSEQEADTTETAENEDAVCASAAVNVLQWLEDELILSLPMFPQHPLCAAQSTKQLSLTEGEQQNLQSNGVKNREQDRQPVHRPFEILAQLRKSE